MPPVKLPPGAVAVDDSPKLPPGAVAVDDQETSAPPTPPAPAKEGFWRSAVAPLVGAVKGFDPRPTPEETQQGLTSAYDYALRPIERVVSSHIDQGKQAVNEFQQAAPLSLHPTADQLAHRQLALGHGLAAAVPVVGPWAASTGEKIGQQVGTGDYSGAVGTGVGNLGLALAPKGVAKVYGKLRPAPTAAGQTTALSSVLARTPMSGDKGYIVQDVADAIKDPLRQAAADNPAITEVALGKDPVKAYGAYQALLTKTKQGFEKTFNSIAGPERSYPVDGQVLASQLSASDALRRMFPNEAEWVDDFYTRLGTVKNLGELDDVRKLLNDRAKSTYKNAAPTMEEGGKVGATRAALDLLRQYFYFKLEEATGQDMSGLKRTEGAVMDAERAGVANGPQLTSAHQKHVEPATPARKVAGIIKGAKVATGNFALPVAGYVADALEGSNLQQLHSYLKRALSDLPQPTPAGATPPPAPMPPYSPKLGPGGPGTALQTAPPQGPRPVGSVQYPNPAGIAAPPPPARPRGLGSMAPAPQLQSGPAAYAGPNTVNTATASTQIAPTLAERTATPPAAPPPGTGMVVGPDGTITLPRKMLQAPAKVGDIINFQGKKMQVAKVFKDGQTALKEVAPPTAPKGKGPAPTKASTKPAAKPAPPLQTPAQMTDSYAAGPEPEGLGGPSVLKGTPIPATSGAKTQLVLPGNRTMPATYQIVESSDLTPSHDPFSFAKNERYPENVQERNYATSKEAQARVVDQEQKFNPDLVINTNPDAVNGPPIITPDGTVLGGNSRAMTLSRVYRNSGGDAYRNALKAQAQTYGIDPAKVDGMRRPVLVRVVDSPGGLESTRRLASDLNRPLTAALGESEKAVSTGRNIKPATMNWISDELSQNDSTLRELMAARGPAILSKLVDDGAIAERERPQYIDSKTGGLNEAGKTFVEKALIGKVLDDPGLIDSTPKGVLQKVERSLGAITSFAQRTDEWNLAPAIRYAVNELGKAQRTGMSTEDFLSQGSLLEAQRNPLLSHLVRAIDGKPTTLRNALMTFAHDAAANPEGQPSFFGGASAHDAFNNAFGTHLTDEEFRRGIEEAQEHER